MHPLENLMSDHNPSVKMIAAYTVANHMSLFGKSEIRSIYFRSQGSPITLGISKCYDDIPSISDRVIRENVCLEKLSR